MISWKGINRKLLAAGALAGALGVAGCAAYPAGYGGYAWGYGPGYYDYGPDWGWWGAPYGFVGAIGVGGPVFFGHGTRHFARGHVPRVAPRGGAFAAAHGGIGRFGARVGGGHFGGGHVGGARMAAGGVGHFGGGR